MTSPLVHDLLVEATARVPEAVAVADGQATLTYRELARRSQDAAHWLRREGVRRGDRVMLVLAGGVDFAVLLYGVLRAGATAVPVHPGTSAYQLGWILRDAAPALVLATGDDASRITVPDPVRLRDHADAVRGAAGAPSASEAAVEPADIALLMYTSGSTAMPLGVMCPHDRVRFAVEAVAARLRYAAGDVVFCRSPMSFDYGLYQLFLCARAGASLTVRLGSSDAALLRDIRDSGATIVPAVPTIATMLHRLSIRDRRPTRVRMITNTGAALTAGLAADLRQAFPGAVIVPMYGMTECKRISIAEPDEDLRHPGTVGRPLDGTEVAVVDDRGELVPAGTVGEIWVRGPHVMAGYWQAPEPSARRFERPRAADRLLRTGDYGRLDATGRLYFAGRRDDIFKRRSVRTSVHEIEAAATDVPGVRAAAVRRPGAGGELVLWVIGDVLPEAVLAGLAERLERAKVPDRCEVVPDLPTTTNGKVDRAALGGPRLPAGGGA